MRRRMLERDKRKHRRNHKVERERRRRVRNELLTEGLHRSGGKEEAEEEKEDLGLIGGLSKRSAHSAKLSSSEIKIMYCIAKVTRSSMDPPLLFGEI